MKVITILGEKSKEKSRLLEDVAEYFAYSDTLDIEIAASDEYDSLLYWHWALTQDFLTEKGSILAAHRLIVAEADYSPLELWDHVFVWPIFTLPGLEQVYVTRLVDWGVGDTVVWLPSDRDLAADKVRAIVEGDASA